VNDAWAIAPDQVEHDDIALIMTLLGAPLDDNPQTAGLERLEPLRKPIRAFARHADPKDPSELAGEATHSALDPTAAVRIDDGGDGLDQPRPIFTDDGDDE